MLATKYAARVKSLQEQPIWIGGAVKPVQNHRLAVQSLLHPCALPLTKPSPSGHPGTADLRGLASKRRSVASSVQFQV